jgi:dGTPase
MLRNRRTIIFTLIFPAALFFAFGGQRDRRSRRHGNVAAYIMVSMALYGAALTAAAAGAMVALERALGWSRQLRLTPLHPVAYILVKAITPSSSAPSRSRWSTSCGLVQGKPDMPVGVWVASALLTLVCTLVFAALGVFVGYLVPGENAMQILGPGLALCRSSATSSSRSTRAPRCGGSRRARRCSASRRSPARRSPTTCPGTPWSTRSSGSRSSSRRRVADEQGHRAGLTPRVRPLGSMEADAAVRRRRPRALVARAAQAGRRARAHAVRARPGPGRARGRVAAAGRQDPGGRPQTDDFVRNRLTHSLEVAQVARDLARALGCHPDIAETAALAHDLGHPPFGHNGERALDELAADCGGFEGNAQTLRLLTRLEAKTFDADGRSVGLNLTRATLDACTKYPWPPRPAARRESSASTRTTCRSSTGCARASRAARCLEAQVMDLADDVAYSVHDVEDGIVAGRVDLTPGRPGGAARLGDGARLVPPRATDDELDDASPGCARSAAGPPTAYDGTRRSMAALKNLTSDLIGRFCGSVQAATFAAYDGPIARYARGAGGARAETATEIAVLKGIAAHYVMQSDDRVALQERQRELLAELVEALVDAAPTASTRCSPRTGAPRPTTRPAAGGDRPGRVADRRLGAAWHRRLTGRPSRLIGATLDEPV